MSKTLPASESEATALSVQPDAGKAKASEPKPADPKAAEKQTEFKVADVFEDGTVALQLEDGRHFRATVDDGVEVKRRASVAIKAGDLDKDGVPVNAVVSKVL